MIKLYFLTVIVANCFHFYCPFTFSFRNPMLSTLSFKRVAIIGGGFGGMAIANKLAEKKVKKIDIYDPCGPGQADGSSVAGGLMYPLSTRGRIVWKGEESFLSAKNLMESVQARSQTTFINETFELIHPVLREADAQIWKTSAIMFPEWLAEVDKTKYHNYVSQDILQLYRIKDSMIINSKLYLKSLWKVVQESSDASWIETKIDNLQELTEKYDIVVIAAGAGTPFLWPSDSKYELNIRYVCGSNLVFENSNRLTVSCVGNQYIVPQVENGQSVLVGGATHDHRKMTSEMYWNDEYSPSIEDCSKAFLPKLLAMNPELSKLKILDIQSGTRLATLRTDLGRAPIVGRHSFISNCWVLSGFSSRGLLYHSLMSEFLLSALEKDDDSDLPSCILPASHYKRPPSPV
jgi:glycine/D-amino acid oxidase-like deaminating enzyme